MRLKWPCATLFALALVASPLRSVRPQTAPTVPSVSTTTNLVLVPVLVRHSGNHVAGFKQEDFLLLQDGKPQTIALFEEVHAVAPSRQVRADEFTNMPGGGAPQQLTIIAIDLINTAPLDQAYLKQEMLKFLDSAANAGEPFALVAITSRGIRVLHDFTTDPKILAATVRRQPLEHSMKESAGGTLLDLTPCALSGAGCGGGRNAEAGERQLQEWVALKTNDEQFEVYRDRVARIDTLSALQQLAQSLRGLPGRKTLVWAGSGTQIFGGAGRMLSKFRTRRQLEFRTSVDFSGAGEATPQNVYTYNLLNSANIAVYPLDARHGSNVSFADFDVNRSDAPLDATIVATQRANSETIAMFQQIAAATGGKPCFNRTDLAKCLTEAAADSRDYYLLGYYTDKDIKPGWHSISVKLKRKDADLRYRNGFLSSPFDPNATRLTDLQLAMLSPLNYTAVPFTGRFLEIHDQGGKSLIKFSLDLPPNALTISEVDSRLAFDVVAVARNIDGKEAAQVAQQVSRMLSPEDAATVRLRGTRYTNKLELPAGDYGIWFVVRDNISGRTGSVTAVVKIPSKK